MADIIYTTPYELRTMSLLKGNNKKLEAKGNREVAIRKNKRLIKAFHQDILATRKVA